ncbi:hypothetical protein ACJX0J_041824 [Zea mays]
MKLLLFAFEQASGLKINFHKSENFIQNSLDLDYFRSSPSQWNVATITAKKFISISEALSTKYFFLMGPIHNLVANVVLHSTLTSHACHSVSMILLLFSWTMVAEHNDCASKPVESKEDDQKENRVSQYGDCTTISKESDVWMIK